MIPVTIWGSLPTANNIGGGVLCIDPILLKPSVDPTNFAYLNSILYVNAGGNFTQTSPLSITGIADAYSAASMISGWRVSVSKGTPQAQLACTGTEQIGQFEGFAYYNYLGASSPTWQDQCGFRYYVAPTTANPNNLGGRIAVALKGDGVNAVAEVMEFSQRTDAIRSVAALVYNFKPINDAGAQLGAPGAGFEKIYLQSTGGVAPVVGAQILNKISGRVGIAAAGASVVVTNNLVGANDVVIPVLMTVDATAKSVIASVVAGIITFTLNAACTAGVTIGFLVLSFQ
jgi:hypothetical protein